MLLALWSTLSSFSSFGESGHKEGVGKQRGRHDLDSWAHRALAFLLLHADSHLLIIIIKICIIIANSNPAIGGQFVLKSWQITFLYHCRDGNDDFDDENDAALMMTFVVMPTLLSFFNRFLCWAVEWHNTRIRQWEKHENALHCFEEGLWDWPLCKVLYFKFQCGEIFSVWECSLRVARGCWCCRQWPCRWP